ncbi:MAG: DNA-binding HxlR family transcriptional regulator [Gammaproteobacteria bacterium]|jgi:DNA-binding HxlR family transcriptional regulator
MLSSEKKYDPLNRSIAHVLELIGEGWSMLIIREAYLGTRRFEAFQKQLGIARNILTARLKKLCENEILERVPIKPGAKRHEYLLTLKGKELMPLLVALTQWGDKWVFGENSEPVTFLDRENREPIEQIKVFSARGIQLRPRDIVIVAGPGASAEAKCRIRELNMMAEADE